MSIKEIAKRAGTSPATVSRVLNNPDYVCQTPELREKIWQAVRDLNYVPNQAARDLKKGVLDIEKNYYINVLMTRTDNTQTDPFFSEVLRVIESEIHKNMCILSGILYKPVFSDDKKCKMQNLDKLIDELRQGENEKCDGLIIMGKCNGEALKKLGKKYKNIVSVNRNSTNYEVDEILCDGHKIAEMAVQYLIDLGHKRIGYVGACENETRYQGFLDTLKKNNIECTPSYVVETEQTESQGYKAMDYFLGKDDMPSGIYCANDITAIGMLKSLRRHKKLPFIPSVISSDDIDAAQFSKPLLTTIRLPKEEMGKFAVYLLLDRMRGGHKSVVRMELEGKLMVRESCQEFHGTL